MEMPVALLISLIKNDFVIWSPGLMVFHRLYFEDKRYSN